MEMRVIKKLTLNPPSLAEHLFPLGHRIDLRLHAVKFQSAIAGFWRRAGRDQYVFILRLRNENFFAVVRDSETAHAGQEQFGFPLAQLKPLERPVVGAVARRLTYRRLDIKKYACLSARQLRVIMS